MGNELLDWVGEKEGQKGKAVLAAPAHHFATRLTTHLSIDNRAIFGRGDNNKTPTG